MFSIKYFLLLALLFAFSVQSNAQYKRRGETLQTRGNKTSKPKKPDYSIGQFKGKWQEFERKNRADSSIVSFNDSIQLYFIDTIKVQTRTSVTTSLTMVGEAEIGNDNLLTVAADEYTVKSLNDGELVLDDGEKFVHRLRKMDSFWFEKLGKTSVRQADYSTPISTTINNILGNWSVYRRKADPGAINDNVPLIKYLNIKGKTSGTAAVGDVTFYKGQDSKQSPCTITLNGSEIKIVAGTTNWTLSIYQSDKDNFVFGNSSLLYFSKLSN